MTIQCCYLEEYDWLIKVCYEATAKDANCILSELDEIGCDPEAFYKLADIIESDNVNWGFTYTDESMHVTFIIIGETTCANEFQSTYDHEKGHAAVHIANALGLHLGGEEYLYLQGEIGKLMFTVAKLFLCDHCRVNFVNYGKVKIKLESGQ